MAVIEKYARLKTEHKELKADLRKLVKKWRKDVYRTPAECAAELDAVSNKKGGE